jgi:hypothetical protein
MQRPHEADEINGRTTWHAQQAPDGLKKLAVRTKAPGVPLLKPVGPGDLMLATLRRAPFSLEG